jgi:hypothetical protein
VSGSAAFDRYLSWDSIKDMGWFNLIWLLLIVFIFLGARAKKVGVTSIGKNEWGMLEIFGFPTVPIPFGFYPFVKGVFHVKEVSVAPARLDLVSRREIKGRVLLTELEIWVQVGQKGDGSLWKRFLKRRSDLVNALYGALDEDVTDAENPERMKMAAGLLEDGCRKVLRVASEVDELTKERLETESGQDLEMSLGMYIRKVLIRADAPVDGQLWKEGRDMIVSLPGEATPRSDLPPQSELSL